MDYLAITRWLTNHYLIALKPTKAQLLIYYKLVTTPKTTGFFTTFTKNVRDPWFYFNWIFLITNYILIYLSTVVMLWKTIISLNLKTYFVVTHFESRPTFLIVRIKYSLSLESFIKLNILQTWFMQNSLQWKKETILKVLITITIE